MMSGSYREGFRMVGLDIDYMFFVVVVVFIVVVVMIFLKVDVVGMFVFFLVVNKVGVIFNVELVLI